MKNKIRRSGSDMAPGMVKKSRGLRFGIIVDEISILEGRVLTIIDAVYSSPEQNKAIKDLIKETFWKTIDGFREVCFKDGIMLDDKYLNDLIGADALIVSREQAKALGIDVDKVEKEAEELGKKSSN